MTWRTDGSCLGWLLNRYWLFHFKHERVYKRLLWLFRGSISGTVDSFQSGEALIKLKNEWAWQRSRTPKGLLEEPLAQVKGQVEIQKVSIASERLLEN